MNLKHLHIVGVAWLVLLCACSRELVPQELGVFADTSSGLIKLTTFAEGSPDNDYIFPSLRHSPASQTIRAFYVNRHFPYDLLPATIDGC